MIITDQLLTKQDLADRWQVHIKTIEEYIRQGVIKPIPKIPSVRFNQQQVLELEGVKIEPFSPLMKKKLENELQEIKAERDLLKGIVDQIMVDVSKGMVLINKYK